MPCEIIRKLSQETSNTENEKINAIKTLLARNPRMDTSINEELKTLLRDKPFNDLNKNIAELWDIQARMAQKMAQLTHALSGEQKQLPGHIENLTDGLKKTCALSANILEEERKKLIVVQEVFKKKANSKVYNRSFREKSFKLALEELLEEKSNLTQVKQVIKEEPEDDMDYTKFYSAMELEKEMDQVQKSFIVPEFKPDKKVNGHIEKSAKGAKDTSPTILPAELTSRPTNKKVELHQLIKRLIDENPVFSQYPVKNPPTNVRLQMPVLRDPNIKINVWAILKENIGKELSKIAMPVYLNEPLSMLQKASEFIEYHEVFRLANKTEDEFLRLTYVASVPYILLSHAINRLKKPFNPLLGETYEYIDGDIKSVFEQVSHHPPVTALYCESNDFIVEGSFLLKSKLSLSGFEFFPVGEFLVTLKRTGELYTLKRPSNSVHNYIIGKMYIWVNGVMECTNTKTNSKIVINFKPKGWTSKNDYEVDGTVTSGSGKVTHYVVGKWDSFLNLIDAETKQEIKIISRYENPDNYEMQYYFSKYLINCNNLTQDLLKKIAPTDVRLRTDLRAYEHGNIDLASSEKHRLEQNQRTRRKLDADGHEIFEPKWFNFEIRGDEIKASLKRTEDYFKCRETGKWPGDLRDLYNDP